ncbi:MAG: hypothetical protein J5I81_07230 [Nitrococcus mobilis]|nr:hypothetical protein [Nitrococcus mobilis]
MEAGPDGQPAGVLAKRLGRSLPLPVGLLFHVAYVAFWSVVFIAAAYPRLTFGRAIGLGLALWVVLLVIFFPIIGWGLLGLGVGAKLIVASLIPHILFSDPPYPLRRVSLEPRPRDAQGRRALMNIVSNGRSKVIMVERIARDELRAKSPAATI